MNTTDDSFPILVRKENYTGGLNSGIASDYATDGRKAGLSTAPSSIGTSILHRNSLGNTQSRRGMLDDLETAQNRPLPDIALPTVQKPAMGKAST